MVSMPAEPTNPHSTLARLVAVINARLDATVAGIDPTDVIRTELNRFAGVEEQLPDEAIAAIDAASRELEAVFDLADPDSVSVALNRILAATSSAPRLSNHGGQRWHLHVDREPFGWASWFLSASALSLATALSEQGRVLWGRCAAPDCQRVFSGSGSGAPQTFCSSRCGSRVRMARQRASINRISN